MPRFLFDFRCTSCDHVFEEIIDNTIYNTDCPKCSREATRLISPVRTKLDGLDPGFPDAHDKWTRQHEKAGRAPVDR